MSWTPASTASRRTAMAVWRSAGGPKTPGPGSCMAPNPIRWTGRPARRTVSVGTDPYWSPGALRGQKGSVEEVHHDGGHLLGVGEDPEVAGRRHLHQASTRDHGRRLGRARRR